jgi:hypothetical protein
LLDLALLQHVEAEPRARLRRRVHARVIVEIRQIGSVSSETPGCDYAPAATYQRQVHSPDGCSSLCLGPDITGSAGQHTGLECPRQGVIPRIVDGESHASAGPSRGTNADRGQLRVNAKKPAPRFDPGGGISPRSGGTCLPVRYARRAASGSNGHSRRGRRTEVRQATAPWRARSRAPSRCSRAARPAHQCAEHLAQ